ncbi:MAG TPA: DUF885 domain-containing protein [Terriglobales bacterium]|nr:DUF885 domain-containing protein [Terriglobales bacterium]
MTSILSLAFTFMLAIFNGGTGAPKQPTAKPAEDEAVAFSKTVDDYFDSYFRFHPTAATAAGFHQQDSELEDFSRPTIDAEIADSEHFLARLDKISSADLSAESAADLDLLRSSIQANLLELKDIQMWRRDPNTYPSQVSYSLFLIMQREFAPQEDRLRLLIARERLIPKVLIEGQQNLSDVPPIYVDVALEQMPGEIDFLRNDVPKAFSAVNNPELLASFKTTTDAAIKAFENYQRFLQKEIQPKANGDFRIGAENYRKKLLYEEMVDVPLDHLLEIGYADLRRNQQHLKEVAAQIDPNRSVMEVLADLRKDHPPAGQLLQSFRDVLGGERQFIIDKKIVTIPSPVLPIVEETPPFARALTTASMDTPGAYDTKATQAMFNVTTPDPKWKPEQIEDWMEGFNRGTIISTSVHEAYPGHYVQFLWVKQAPSKVRKLIFCGSNAEGWAHYTEQMMLDEGFGNGDPKLRMGQLIDALLRNARFIAGIEMHTGKMTMEQARQFFIDEGYQVSTVADMEAKRGTSDPTYLVYTLGKLQIMKLREDYKKQRGDQFSLQDFHDRFLQQGSVPLKIIRKAMLGNDSPTL